MRRRKREDMHAEIIAGYAHARRALTVPVVVVFSPPFPRFSPQKVAAPVDNVLGETSGR